MHHFWIGKSKGWEGMKEGESTSHILLLTSYKQRISYARKTGKYSDYIKRHDGYMCTLQFKGLGLYGFNGTLN